MNRYSPPEMAQPGDCTAIVNLRKKSNCLKPVGSPELLYNNYGNDSRKIIYIHNCYDGEHLITADTKGLYVEALILKNDEVVFIKKDLLLEITDLQLVSVQSIGNTLIVVCAEHIYYLLYKEEKSFFLGEKPEIPEISFYSYTEYTDAYFVSEYTFLQEYSKPTRLDTDDINYFNDAYYNAFFELQEKAWKRKYFIQPILVRYTLTLYDDSKLFASTPVMVSLPEAIQPNQMSIRLRNSNDLCLGSYEGQIIAGNYSLRYVIHRLKLDDWKDIIKSIDFYVAPEATIFEPDKKQQGLNFTITRQESDGIISYYLKGNISFLDYNDIKNKYLQAPLFYKIASIENWSELEEGGSYTIENKIRPDQLVYEEVLSPDNTTLLSTGAQVSYIHNNQLHIANLKKTLFPGFPISLLNTGGKTGESVEAYICTYLKTERGESKVVWSGSSNYFSNQLSPLISYPDSNAYKMEIVAKGNGAVYRGIFPLTASDYENRADFLDESLTPISLEKYSSTSALSIPSPQNNTYTQHNIMRVSKRENPFVFPAEQTYTISNGEITGIATITRALSEGQFGEFPLYIFTDEGIWALQNGSNMACYGSQYQLTRETISKGTPIIPLEDFIIFSSGKGLSAIRGIEIQPFLSFDENLTEDNMPILFHHIDTSLLDTVFDSTSLADFIADSSITYNATEKELICQNPNFKYCIVIHIPTLYIYRLNREYLSIFYDASHLLAQDFKGNVYNLQKEDEKSEALEQFALMSRPLTLQSEEFQKWKEIFWRLSTKKGDIEVSVWATNKANGQYYQLCKIQAIGDIPEIPMRITGPAFKYFRLVLSGEAQIDFCLSAVDIHFDIINFNNKLR